MLPLPESLSVLEHLLDFRTHRRSALNLLPTGCPRVEHLYKMIHKQHRVQLVLSITESPLDRTVTYSVGWLPGKDTQILATEHRDAGPCKIQSGVMKGMTANQALP